MPFPSTAAEKESKPRRTPSLTESIYEGFRFTVVGQSLRNVQERSRQGTPRGLNKEDFITPEHDKILTDIIHGSVRLLAHLIKTKALELTPEECKEKYIFGCTITGGGSLAPTPVTSSYSNYQDFESAFAERLNNIIFDYFAASEERKILEDEEEADKAKMTKKIQDVQKRMVSLMRIEAHYRTLATDSITVRIPGFEMELPDRDYVKKLFEQEKAKNKEANKNKEDNQEKEEAPAHQ